MTTVHRIEVWPKRAEDDPRAAAARREAMTTGIHPVPERIDCATVYLLEGELDPDEVSQLADELFADPVADAWHLGSSPARGDALIEVHPKAGVMDPDAQAVETAIAAMLGSAVRVRTGRRYDFHGVDADAARRVTERSFANPVVHDVRSSTYHPDAFAAGHEHAWEVRTVPLGDLDDAGLEALSRSAHLFLSLDEMRAVQAAYAERGRDPREIELETIAQTWSEHCVHKTLKATIRFEGALPGGAACPGVERHDDGAVTFSNLLKCTVVAATERLMADGVDWCLSVFVDNAGVVAFDDEIALCIKVETHNHPSAIEPYGGAATGIGGCIRDVIGTGLAAKPIAATDVFCVAHPDHFARDPEDGGVVLPAGCLHPGRILRQVVAGVRDYGNRMGIPTLSGAVWFDDRYVGNPLVYCGCVGMMRRDRVEGDPAAGDRIIALGGRTGRDGIHGATFSSAELTDTHADEFSHAVQIGNAVTEKTVLDAILAASEFTDASGERRCLFRAITDCGAGGFSSAVGEMGEHLGAVVQLERAPLKYEGLTPTEIWISEAQERMVLAVAPENVDAIAAICATHGVEWCDLGHFGTEGRELILRYEDVEVGRLDMAFMHDGLPGRTRAARWTAPEPARGAPAGVEPPTVEEGLRTLLQHPNIASKHWIVQQYDHEVQGRTVIKPLVGPDGAGPGDASVIRPRTDSNAGAAIAQGLATGLASDPYRMALAAVDECVRNLVCVGADPERIAILDNFCWPGCDDPERLGALVCAAVGCHDAALAYRTPFVSGKDSLNNQFTAESGETIRIPPTLLITGLGHVPDVHGCVTMDAKTPGNLLVLVGTTSPGLAGSHLALCFGDRVMTTPAETALPDVDVETGARTARAVAAAIRAGAVRSAHDPSEGGALVAAAEMAMASGLGLRLDLLEVGGSDLAASFAETPGRYLLEVAPADLDTLDRALAGTPYAVVGEFTDDGRLRAPEVGIDVAVADLLDLWRRPLDW